MNFVLNFGLPLAVGAAEYCLCKKRIASYCENDKKYKLISLIFLAAIALFTGITATVRCLDFVAPLTASAVVGMLWFCAVADYEKKIIPNYFLLIMLIFWASIIVSEIIFLAAQGEEFLPLLIGSAIGGLTGGLLFLIVMLLSRGGMGMGDVKLVAVLGLYFGFEGLLSVLIYSMLCAFLYGLTMIITKKAGLKTKVAMAPFFFVGTILYCLMQQLLN